MKSYYNTKIAVIIVCVRIRVTRKLELLLLPHFYLANFDLGNRHHRPNTNTHTLRYSALSVNSINNSLMSSHHPAFPVAPPNQPSAELNPLKSKSLGYGVSPPRSMIAHDEHAAVYYTDNGDKINDLGKCGHQLQEFGLKPLLNPV